MLRCLGGVKLLAQHYTAKEVSDQVLKERQPGHNSLLPNNPPHTHTHTSPSSTNSVNVTTCLFVIQTLILQLLATAFPHYWFNCWFSFPSDLGLWSPSASHLL